MDKATNLILITRWSLENVCRVEIGGGGVWWWRCDVRKMKVLRFVWDFCVHGG